VHIIEKKRQLGGFGRLRAAVLSLALTAVGALTVVPVAAADSLGPVSIESPNYSIGNINAQRGWMKTNAAFDVNVANIAGAPGTGYGFGAQALRLSNAVTSGSFGDQTFSPALKSAAGEGGARQFNAGFEIGTTTASPQAGLAFSVSPDDGQGSRMSYLRFEEGASGVKVFFVDVSDPGPLPTVASFDETEIATVSRGAVHKIGFAIEFVPGPGNDVVKISIDGAVAHTGTTWEDYYRFDPEQTGGNNQLPVTSRLLFRVAGTAVPANSGNGFLIDHVELSSEGAPGPTGATGSTGSNGAGGASGDAGAKGATGAAGSNASLALKRKMAITFPKATVATSGKWAEVLVRCSGSTAQRCVGTLALKSKGTLQRAAYSVLRGETVTVSVPLGSDLQELLSSGDSSGTTVRAVARTEQDAGRPFRTSRKLRIG
jgi:hypothetical protein